MNNSFLALGLAAMAAPLQADTLQLTADLDNTLYEQASGLLSNGAGNYIFAGKTTIGSLRRAVLHFDVAGALPPGSAVNSVGLRLEMSMTVASIETLGLHRATASWGEGASHAPGEEGSGDFAQAGDATWLHRFFQTTFWTTPGGDFAATPSASLAVGGFGSYTWSSATLTSDVQSMLDSPGGNHGWLLKNVDEGPVSTTKRFNSRQYIQAGTRPTLVIDFTPPTCVAVNYCSSGPNSTGSAAQISMFGSCSVSANQFSLSALPVPNTVGIFFYSTGQTNGGAGSTFGNGLRCVGAAGGSIVRLQPSIASGNQLLDSLDFNNLPSNGQIVPGATWNFQAWFRDPAAGGALFDLSDGLQVTFLP